MKRIAVACLLAMSSVAGADVQVGGQVGFLITTLEGQLDQGWAPKAGIGVPVTFTLGDKLVVGFEPTLKQSGSPDYALTYFDVPIVARLRYPVGRVHLRAIAGIASSFLLGAVYDFMDIDDQLHTLDIAAVVGFGVDATSRRHRTYFAELRFTRGLFTLHGDPGFFVVNEAVGLWMGIVR